MSIFHPPVAFKCCGEYPLLRLRPTVVFKQSVDYVQFECQKCGRVGGRGITEEEAAILWDDTLDSPKIPEESL